MFEDPEGECNDKRTSDRRLCKIPEFVFRETEQHTGKNEDIKILQEVPDQRRVVYQGCRNQRPR